MEYSSKEPEGQLVIHDILDFHAILYFSEKMLVMPERIRARSLLIDKIFSVDGMGDLRKPVDADIPKGSYVISYQLSGIDLPSVGGHDLKGQISGSYLFQISRR